jgi:hypothetical protein
MHCRLGLGSTASALLGLLVSFSFVQEKVTFACFSGKLTGSLIKFIGFEPFFLLSSECRCPCWKNSTVPMEPLRIAGGVAWCGIG